MGKQERLIAQITQLIAVLDKKEQQEIFDNLFKSKGIPISAFKSDLSGLEIIVRYLKDTEKMAFKEIAILLNRKLPTIYTTYRISQKKWKNKLDITDNSHVIPTNIFGNRKHSILESIVAYMHDTERLQFKEISKLIGRKYPIQKLIIF